MNLNKDNHQCEKNKSALDYALSISKTITDVTSPLFQTFDLTTFGYKRVFKDGQYIFFSTNQAWLEYHHKHIDSHGLYFANAMNHALMTDGFLRVLWPAQNGTTDHFLEALHQWEMWNGFNFYKKRDDSIELWTFSTTPDKYQDSNAYLGIIPYLERFIVYFNATTADILNSYDDQKLAAYNDGQKIFSSPSLEEKDTQLKTFLEQTAVKKLPIFSKEGIFYLSIQESNCLRLLASGKSAKEIARILNISPRTVEGYLGNIKLKLGCSCKSSLINTLNETFTHLGHVNGHTD